LQVQPEAEILISGGHPEQFAVVLAGEALEHVTGGCVSATQHRVTSRFGKTGRVSCPYLLYARRDARLQVLSGNIGRGARAAAASTAAAGGATAFLTAEEFVRASQLRKASAVYATD
jgi:isopenicillin N synthase-like dioxygenase